MRIKFQKQAQRPAGMAQIERGGQTWWRDGETGILVNLGGGARAELHRRSEDQWGGAIPQNVKQNTPTTQQCHSQAHGQESGKHRSTQTLYTNVHWAIIQSGPQMETMQRPISCWTHKRNVAELIDLIERGTIRPGKGMEYLYTLPHRQTVQTSCWGGRTA